jgi:ureidoacrylate peracid hydrolase
MGSRGSWAHLWEQPVTEQEILLEQGRYGGPQFHGLINPVALVVDMTNDFGHPDGVYARHGAVCTAFPPAVTAARTVLEACARVSVPTITASQVIYANPEGRAVTGAGLVASRPWLLDEGLRPGSWGVQLVDELPRTDYFVEKPCASAFYATPLDVLLRGLDAKTVIVMGCYTNQCIDSTARDAWARDFDVVIVEDAVAAFDERLHRATLESLSPLATLLSSAALIEMLAARELKK